MGCDIHIIAEVKENGKWRKNTDSVFKNHYYKSKEDLEEIRKNNPNYTLSDYQEVEFQSNPGSGRNYDWFAVLADVRNGRGFAGVVTGEGFSVIAEPKGIPDDCCEEWKQTTEDWRGDMHSHSYLDVDELVNFDWDQATNKRGVISIGEYKNLMSQLKKSELDPMIEMALEDLNEEIEVKLVDKPCPETWSGWISGGDVVVVDEVVADRILKGENIKGSHVDYTWGVKYSEWFDYQIDGIVEPLKKLKEKYEDARIVFGFDN